MPRSKTITKIKKDYGKEGNGPIGNFFKEAAKDEEHYKKILDNYIRSCAGYCTATYLLGIGDRHLENLMIDKDGFFFHIDFGFIFGKEPGGKGGLASKIRVTKTMIAAMEGLNSENYKKFEDFFVKSFQQLRNKKNYILNLMYLMINSGIRDLSYEQHQSVLM